MKNLVFWLILFPFCAIAQSSQDFNTITKVEEGLFFMYYDSSFSKSTIVEFKHFIALLEVPIKDEGGGARDLKDHSEGAEKVMRSLQHYFPKKPLKYVLHSHWHPHSISSVKPFLEKGVQLISTKTNFEKMSAFIDEKTATQYAKQIQFVETDSLVISDKTNKIVAYRFLQKDFPATPTTEYLYFHLPKYNFLHCGCMYSKWNGQPVEGKTLITGREADLHKFIASQHLKPRFLIRLAKEKTEANDMQPFEGLENNIKNGISAQSIAARYKILDTQTLNSKQDSLIKAIIQNNIPVSIFNSLAYNSLKEQDFPKALAFAKIQMLVKPFDVNSWDTLGEVYFFAGEEYLATQCEKQCKLLDSAFNSGGKEAWKKDLEEYSKGWKTK